MFLRRIPYHIGFRLAQYRRRQYIQKMDRVLEMPLREGPPLPINIVSYSGKRDLPEQVACWRYVIENLGVPEQLLVVSDGTHSPADERVINGIHPKSQLVHYEDFIAKDTPECVHEYARIHPLGRKVAIFIAIQKMAPVLYTDSDLIYFPGASHFRGYLDNREVPVRYLLDCAKSHDLRLIADPAEQEQPVNSGFLYFSRGIDFSPGLERLEKLKEPAGYFSEQTLVHLSVRKAGGVPLPTDRYVLRADDQWLYRDRFATETVAIRHYISSIRYKMWNHVPLP